MDPPPDEKGDAQSTEPPPEMDDDAGGAETPLPMGADDAFEMDARGGGTTISSSSCRADEPKMRGGDDERALEDTVDGGRPIALPMGATLTGRGLVRPCCDEGGGASGDGPSDRPLGCGERTLGEDDEAWDGAPGGGGPIGVPPRPRLGEICGPPCCGGGDMNEADDEGMPMLPNACCCCGWPRFIGGGGGGENMRC